MSIPRNRAGATEYYLGVLDDINENKFKPIIEIVKIMTNDGEEPKLVAKYDNYVNNFQSLLKDIEEKTGKKGIQIDSSLFYGYISDYYVDYYDEDEGLNEFISVCLETALTRYMGLDDYERSGGPDSGHEIFALAEAFKQRITQILESSGGGGIKRKSKRRNSKRVKSKRRNSKRGKSKRSKSKRSKSKRHKSKRGKSNRNLV